MTPTAPTGLTIRDAGPGDEDALQSLFVAAGIEARDGAHVPMAEAWARLRAAVPSSRVLLAERAGVPVGALTFIVLPSLSHRGSAAALVESVAVDPKAQRQGIGRALMDAAMQAARQAGCYKLALSSNARRTTAHAFYERLGYAVHGLSFAIALEEGARSPGGGGPAD